MENKKHVAGLAGLVLSVSLIASSLTALLLANYGQRAQVQALGTICQNVIEKRPEAKQAVLSALKEYQQAPAAAQGGNILLEYGYGQADFLQPAGKRAVFFAAAGFAAGFLMFFLTLLLWHRKEAARIKRLTEYLEKVNHGSGGVLFPAGEGNVSKLQDEIYKTVTELHQARDAALKAKNNFADNLSNIAHQIKTPVTSISLSLQMMRHDPSAKHLEQAKMQISRLTHLEEALLLLSRIDAGTLALKQKETDVFTLLALSADNLQELFEKAGVSVQIPEAGEALIDADLDWTMEAIMNLLKNCMEHTPSGGTVYCSYEQNPFCTRIQIRDTGTGFAKEDIPRLFERFYRGRDAKKDGIGIGLAIAKAIIENQNGTVRAENHAGGGACFEVRFYKR